MKNEALNKRIVLIDEIRGFAIICMVLYHTMFIAGEIFNYDIGNKLFDFFSPVEPFFAGIFIFICGLSCTLSKNNFKRGIIIFSCGLAFTIFTCLIMPKLGFEYLKVYFGILHFLGVSVLVYCLIEKLNIRINPYIGIVVCVFLYPFFSGISKGYLSYGELFTLSLPEKLYESDILMPLGIYSPSFYSGDYFPIFPSIFIFFAGSLIGKIYSANGYPECFYKNHLKFLSFAGRKTLIIYLAHMPLIYAFIYAVDYIRLLLI